METEIRIGEFRELPPETRMRLNGGCWAILAGIAVALTAEIVSDWDNFKNGLMGLPEEK